MQGQAAIGMTNQITPSDTDPIITVVSAENGFIINRSGHYQNGKWTEPKPYICDKPEEVAEAIKVMTGG